MALDISSHGGSIDLAFDFHRPNSYELRKHQYLSLLIITKAKILTPNQNNIKINYRNSTREYRMNLYNFMTDSGTKYTHSMLRTDSYKVG